MLRTRRLSVAAALSFCLLLACGDKINPNGTYQQGTGGTGGTPSVGGIDGGGTGTEPSAAPSYTYEIMPLLKKSCLCHVQGGQPPLLDTYANVVTNADKSLKSMQNGTMPIGAPLSKSEIDPFLRWVNATPPTPNN